MIITIDGGVATGKSSIARKLAEYLGFIYFDTGAMYRAVTWAIEKQGVDIQDEQQLKAFLDSFQFAIRMQRGVKHYFVDETNVTNDIRSQAVTRRVSEVSAKKAVREKMVALQRQMARGVNAIFEGRDTGTSVFPDADLKIFLTGRPEVRARRRFEELKRERPQEAEEMNLEQMQKEVEARDHYDSTREISPLIKAEDAFTVDTSDLTIDEVVFQILECKDQAKKRVKGKG